MKTVEEKAKAYDKAIERAKIALDCCDSASTVTKNTIYDILPELRESEDEKMRKQLLNWFKGCHWDSIDDGALKRNDIIAWLEKQDEQKVPVISVDKVQPKFKKGDWVVSDCNNVAYIESISETKYNLQCQDGYHDKMSIEYIDRCWHLWSIEDAKPGDVLVSQKNKPFIYNGNHDSFHIGSYCGISVEDRFIVATEECHWTGNANIHPATKEQRELLFQKMKEAGYEWNYNKKELKKSNTDFYDLRTWKYIVDAVWTEKEGVGQYIDSPFTEEVAKKLQKRFGNIKQNPAWSGYDETLLTNIIIMLKEGASLHFNKKDITKAVDWLKSFKAKIGG